MSSVPSTRATAFVSPAEEQDRFLPEGPRFLKVHGRQSIVWINIQTTPDSDHGAIHWYDLEKHEHRHVPLDGRPGFFLPTSQPDVLLVGQDKEMGLFNLLTDEWTSWARIPDDNPRTIINDGELVPGGKAVVFGTKDLKFSDPVAELYLLDIDSKRISRLAAGQTCSNGKIIHRGETGFTLFDIDTPQQVVRKYRLDLDKSTVEDEGVVVDLHQVDGFPDGMVDVGDQSAIIAIYNPNPVTTGKALRFRLDTGEMVEEWETPGSPRVTCPLLVPRQGPANLILTTAVEGMPEDLRAKCPDAGCLFIAETSITTTPSPEEVQLP